MKTIFEGLVIIACAGIFVIGVIEIILRIMQ